MRDAFNLGVSAGRLDSLAFKYRNANRYARMGCSGAAISLAGRGLLACQPKPADAVPRSRPWFRLVGLVYRSDRVEGAPASASLEAHCESAMARNLHCQSLVGGAMKTSRIASLCLLLLVSSVARAQGTSVTNQPMGAGAGPQPGSASEEVRPPTAAPGQAPPVPPQQPPPAPGPSQGKASQQIEQTSSPAQAAGAGQWVYTSEYGWIWMPYGDQYTHEGMANDDSPYSYAYYPSYGWMWLAAPWVWGWGAHPYFGSLGPSGFGWYRGLYRAGYGWGGYRGGGRGDYGMGGGNRGKWRRLPGGPQLWGRGWLPRWCRWRQSRCRWISRRRWRRPARWLWRPRQLRRRPRQLRRRPWRRTSLTSQVVWNSSVERLAAIGRVEEGVGRRLDPNLIVQWRAEGRTRGRRQGEQMRKRTPAAGLQEVDAGVGGDLVEPGAGRAVRHPFIKPLPGAAAARAACWARV